MSSLSSGGGGSSAIYEDGEPISIQLSSGESTTVPSGETWILDIYTHQQSYIDINGLTCREKATNSGGHQQSRIVLQAGDTIAKNSSGSGNAHLGGFAV